MTEAEKQRAEKEAEDDAKELGLLLILAFRKKSRSSVDRVIFDSRTGKFYIDRRAVTARSIIKNLELITDSYAKQLVKITLQLEKGEITLSEWKREFERRITSAHLLKAAFALGGIGVAIRNTTVIDHIDAQLAYHDKFTEAIRKGKAGTFAKILARAKLYNHAPHILFTDLQLELAVQTGLRTEARNLLRPAEHCFTDSQRIGCPDLTAKGWLPVDEMVPVGQRRCGRWCRCYLEFR